MRFSHHTSAVLDKLRLFLVVLEEGSLRRTAQRLHISQSAITRQLQQLEDDLGGRVLERTAAGVRPTNGGHALAEKRKRCLQITIPRWPKPGDSFAETATGSALATSHQPCRS